MAGSFHSYLTIHKYGSYLCSASLFKFTWSPILKWQENHEGKKEFMCFAFEICTCTYCLHVYLHFLFLIIHLKWWIVSSVSGNHYLPCSWRSRLKIVTMHHNYHRQPPPLVSMVKLKEEIYISQWQLVDRQASTLDLIDTWRICNTCNYLSVKYWEGVVHSQGSSCCSCNT